MSTQAVGFRGAVPTVALVIGDPAGISPELTAKLLDLAEFRSTAQLVVYGDRRILEEGARVAGVALDVDVVTDDPAPGAHRRPVLVDLRNLAPSEVKRGEATRAGGVFAIENFRRALEAAKDGRAGAVCYTPFNKHALRLAWPGFGDDIQLAADAIGFRGPAREFNILEGLWNARVTSHIPLADVARSLTVEGIVAELVLADRCLREAGLATPRIAVAALNPHGGDGGNYGREEIDVIAPAVKAGVEAGVNASGPFPADTIFVRARSGAFDAVLTMFHDQGQIAMKLLGFDRGVTLLGGMPFPVCTPAHGTAYDIAGRGVANVGASRAALLLAIRMARQQLEQRSAARSPAVGA